MHTLPPVIDLDALVAIDVHTHVQASQDGTSFPEDSPEAAVAKVFGSDALLTVPELAAYYRERKMACVAFMVDSVRWGGKYFGDQPERSMYTCGLWTATDNASSCQGTEGWAMMIGMSGKSAATSSRQTGLEYFRRIPPPPRWPDPTAVCPVWKTAGSPCSAITS